MYLNNTFRIPDLLSHCLPVRGKLPKYSKAVFSHFSFLCLHEQTKVGSISLTLLSGDVLLPLSTDNGWAFNFSACNWHQQKVLYAQTVRWPSERLQAAVSALLNAVSQKRLWKVEIYSVLHPWELSAWTQLLLKSIDNLFERTRFLYWNEEDITFCFYLHSKDSSMEGNILWIIRKEIIFCSQMRIQNFCEFKENIEYFM